MRVSGVSLLSTETRSFKRMNLVLPLRLYRGYSNFMILMSCDILVIDHGAISKEGIPGLLSTHESLRKVESDDQVS
jgi:hypothetical protein